MAERTPGGPLMAATNVRLTPAQQRALELLAESNGLGVSTMARELIADALSRFTDADGVSLLETCEAEVAQERVLAKRLVARFGPNAATTPNAS